MRAAVFYGNYASAVQTSASLTPPREIGSRIVSALVALQRNLSQLTSPDAMLLLKRADLLFQLGHHEAALRDAEAAHSMDSADPLALLALCRLDAEHADERARSVLASPFATDAQRQTAIAYIDPNHLPATLQCSLPAMERLTLLQRPEDQISLTGLEDGDFPAALGRADGPYGPVIATDFFLLRASIGPRQIALKFGGNADSFTVADFGKPPSVAVAQDVAPLWVVIPVKDGGDVLATCLDSLCRAFEAMPDLRVILVDDLSELPETRRLLKTYSTVPGFTVLRSKRQLGFTGAVNLGLAQVGKGPVLLLNSDTYLPPDTLGRMLAHLEDPTVGTVTPLSNNGGSFSIPAPRIAHAMPDPATCDQIAQAAWALNRGTSVDVLTGNGYAMLISGACLQRVGALSHHYTSGYYEEVDFCLRAAEHGFRHVAAVDCFVGHVGAVSYGPEKRRLVAENRRRLYARFPEYADAYARFDLLDPIAPWRERLMEAVDWSPVSTNSVEQTAEQNAVPLTVHFHSDEELLLPLIGLEEALCQTLNSAFARVRLVLEMELDAAGISLRPRHGFTAVVNQAQRMLVVREGSGAQLAAVPLDFIRNDNLARFENAVLRALRMGQHAIFV